ncbi:RagB/SusD family nutrient uptake outer membrane protein [Sphingobacterium sp. SGG-5]|uniref:RagB/SusD family nutrient uptake outer membrane protein n=1 Tax=Sphingobacterium sp. SGG-5 TaxID=2710881 RepID=UPI0013EA03D2|nr:RagB/SusD family nutrient uptake outer membrane protein [Sphingobacterium sp. SGG-5]NGM62241.1 RagB/SusD family nutrient uptake outer membrane protein [Sphingobacterium sp. SGG-5]
MMKYRYYFLFALCLFSVSSCDLTKEPLDFLDAPAYYDTAEDLESNLAAVYDKLGHRDVYGQWMLYRMGLEADEGYYARTTPAFGPQVYDFTSSDADIFRHWTALYTGIGRANILLANIDSNPEIDQSVRDRVRGETLFLRGYYYFLLVQYYGGVPLVLEPTSDVNDIHKPRASAAQVYAQILKDMETAEALVDDIQTVGFGGRVNKSAVRGILARVCLHMAGNPVNDKSKYEQARFWAKKVIDDTDAAHALNPNFSQVFINYAQDIYDIHESIWEVEFRGNGEDAWTEEGGVGYVNGPATTNADIGNTINGVRTTAKLYTAYKEGDLRRDWTIADFTYVNATGAKTFATSTARRDVYTRNSAKYRREYEILLPKRGSVTPQNFALLRFSDVLLMFAEADYEANGGPSPEAIEAVNRVRRRAWSTGIKSVTITNGGSGYTAAPTVTFEGGGGSGAKATVTVLGGQVTGVVFDRDAVTGHARGAGYTSAPTITFTGAGTGATADVEIYKKEEAELNELEIGDFRKTIQDERLRELAFETLRKTDLIRWGIFVFNMKRVGQEILADIPDAHFIRQYNNISDKHLLWPIPATEMSVNRALTQNPKW